MTVYVLVHNEAGTPTNRVFMKFRTEYNPQLADKTLDPLSPVVLVGSCFTDSIGAKMRDCRWPSQANSCGVLYNPASIANILTLSANDDEAKVLEAVKRSIVSRDGIYLSWLTDSKTYGTSEAETADTLIGKLSEMREALSAAGVLIVTFGTSWIYELTDSPGYIVSNCHKFPSKDFKRHRLSVDEIVSAWQSTVERLRDLNPDLRLIFTVSPIRHLKDGFEGNARSKATLLLACERLCSEIEGADYFPAYEIITDDLRDYRFYADDLLHPSSLAVTYVWEKFCKRYLSEQSRHILAAGEKITKAMNHRPNIQI